MANLDFLDLKNAHAEEKRALEEQLSDTRRLLHEATEQLKLVAKVTEGLRGLRPLNEQAESDLIDIDKDLIKLEEVVESKDFQALIAEDNPNEER